MEGEFVQSVAVERRRRLRPRARPRLRVSDRTLKAVPYAGAAVSYVGAGIFVTEILLSWFVAFGWLLAWTWGLPSLLRRLRR